MFATTFTPYRPKGFISPKEASPRYKKTCSRKYSQRSTQTYPCRVWRTRLTQNINRIGVFYDGNYFHRVSDFYRFHHPRLARISISGFHEFLRHEIANMAGGDTPCTFLPLGDRKRTKLKWKSNESNCKRSKYQIRLFYSKIYRNIKTHPSIQILLI